MTRILLIGSSPHTAELARLLVDAEVRESLPSNVASVADFTPDVILDLSLEGEQGTRRTAHACLSRAIRPDVVYVSALTTTATAAASAWPEVPVGSLGWLPGISARADCIELAGALQIAEPATDLVRRTVASLLKRDVELVSDRLGLVSARILAQVINEAAFAVMEGVASAEDIDTAMRLGTNYPLGPLEWVDRVGAGVIVSILDALYLEYHEERYRTCVLLRQHARAGQLFRASSPLSSPVA